MSGVEQRTVSATEDGWRLDRWVSQHYPAVTHGRLQKLLRTGQFRLNGKRVEAGARLATGQTIRIPPLDDAPPPSDQPRKAPLRSEDARLIRSLVVHEDESVIVIDKPAGLAVQGGTGTSRHVDGMLDAFGVGEKRPRLVHRLDRDTTGLLVLARSAKAARELMHAFQQHRIQKLYWAILVRGPERNEGVIDLALAKRGGAGAEKMQAGEGDDMKHASTAFRVLSRAGKVAAWTALLPLTGRTHQLRAHCAAIEAPIMGDGKYGGAKAQLDGVPKGLMLHARELSLPHPGGKRLNLKAEPPKAFKEALAWLGLTHEEMSGASLREWPDERR